MTKKARATPGGGRASREKSAGNIRGLRNFFRKFIKRKCQTLTNLVASPGRRPRGPDAERAAAVPRRERARGVARFTRTVPTLAGCDRAAAVSGVGRRTAWLASPGRCPAGRVPSVPRPCHGVGKARVTQTVPRGPGAEHAAADHGR